MPLTSHVHRQVLPSGLTVLAERHATAPVVAVVAHVKAGYFDEPDAWSGIAHVLEHMYFKGSASLGPGELARAIQHLGGYANAGTIYDKTVYYAVAPSAAGTLERLVELQADALRHLTLDGDELAREREVIVQEAGRKLDTPGAVTVETLYGLLYRRHRMGRWRIGTPDGLRRLTADDLRAYYRSRYAPGRVILSLAGDLDPVRALALAERAFGDWRDPTPPIEGSPEEPPGTPGELKLLRGDIARPLAALGWRTVGPAHPDAPALDVAADVLSAGRTAWLDRAVRDEGLAAVVAADHYTPPDIGVFTVTLTAEAHAVAAAVTRVGHVVAALAERGPRDDDVARVRALRATGWARRLEAAEGRATAFAEFEALGGYALLDTYVDRVQRLSANEIRRAVATWLTDGPAGVVYLPKGTAATLDPERWPPASGSYAPDPAVSITPSARQAADRTATRSAPADVRWRQARGVDLVAREQRGSGLVALGIVVPWLRDAETPETAGRSRLLARAALRAAGGAFAVAAERLGGSLGAASGAEAVGWTLTVPLASAAAAATLLATLVEQATFAPADVAVEARLQADLAAAARDDLYRYPMQRVLAAAFGADPVALPPLGDPAQVRRTTHDDLAAWLQRWRHGRPLGVIAGDLPGDQLLDALEAATRDWPARQAGARRAPASWTGSHVVEQRDKEQSALALAFPAPPAADAGRHARTVVGAVLSGLAGRLFEELREKRSLAYTVQAAPWLRGRAGAMLAYVATAPERVDEARATMLAEFARLAGEPVAADDLARARHYAAGLAVLRTVHTATVLAELLDGWCTGTLADLAEGPARLRAVTADEVLAAAQDFTRPRAEFLLRAARS